MDGAMGITAKMLVGAACVCAAQGSLNGQSHGIICTHGEGQFTAVSKTGETVAVGAQKGNGFATRACQATLTWKKHEMPVARNAWQVDVDAMDVDLGLGAPAVAFQVKQTSGATSMSYAIYLLRGSPQPVRTITGGGLFRAADTDMDGRVEIWATDAGAADQFEGIPLANFDTLPTIAMRFEKQRLMDVSAEFEGEYDRQIALARAGLDAGALLAFKNSDGRFDRIPPWETDKIRSLQNTKTKVLEMVWGYLYSGREEKAWQVLGEMWPSADLSRIRALLVKAHAGGICSEVDGVSRPGFKPRKLSHVHVYDMTQMKRTVDADAAAFTRFPQAASSANDAEPPSDVTRPHVISLNTPSQPESGVSFPRQGVRVDMIVDVAGKVKEATLVNEKDDGPLRDLLLTASRNWKFIPAMDHGRAVASHIRMVVSPYQ